MCLCVFVEWMPYVFSDHRGQKRLSDLELKVVVSFLMCILGTNAVPLEEQKLTLTTQTISPFQESFIKKGKCLMLVEACHRAAVKELILDYVSGLC